MYEREEAGGAARVSVLAIDDSRDDLTILSHHLGRMIGVDAEVRAFLDPDEGVSELGRRGFDVVLLDYRMGATTGPEILAAMKARGIDVPAILVTDQGDEELAVESLHGGFADYLPKQAISPKSLRRAILNTIEKTALRRALERSRVELEGVCSDLKRRNQEIRGFYHELSHELKTPLTAIREFVSIVLDGLQGPVNDDQRESLETAKAACDHMVSCLNDIVDAARIETGKLTLRPARHEVGDVVGRAVAELASTAGDAGVELTGSVTPGCGSAVFDEERILQVLINLVGNAIKFTEPGGHVAVEASRDRAADLLVVRVTDDGRGIPADAQTRIFERLQQVTREDASSRGGLGIGLNLCRELVRLHGGTIEVRSELGAGSQFTFRIPIEGAEQRKRNATTHQEAFA